MTAQNTPQLTKLIARWRVEDPRRQTGRNRTQQSITPTKKNKKTSRSPASQYYTRPHLMKQFLQWASINSYVKQTECVLPKLQRKNRLLQDSRKETEKKMPSLHKISYRGAVPCCCTHHQKSVSSVPSLLGLRDENKYSEIECNPTSCTACSS